MRHNIIDDKIYARLVADTELKDAYAEKSFPVPGGSPQKNKEFQNSSVCNDILCIYKI